MSRWVRQSMPICCFSSEHIENTASVYVFIGDGRVVYVGESMRPERRMGEHWKRCSTSIQDDGEKYSEKNTPWGDFKTLDVAIRPAKRRGESAMAERRLIWRLQPNGNRTHKSEERKKLYTPKKTTPEQVMAIRADYNAGGFKMTEIAKRNNVSDCVAYNICKGRTHVA